MYIIGYLLKILIKKDKYKSRLLDGLVPLSDLHRYLHCRTIYINKHYIKSFVIIFLIKKSLNFIVEDINPRRKGRVFKYEGNYGVKSYIVG